VSAPRTRSVGLLAPCCLLALPACDGGKLSLGVGPDRATAGIGGAAGTNAASSGGTAGGALAVGGAAGSGGFAGGCGGVGGGTTGGGGTTTAGTTGEGGTTTAGTTGEGGTTTAGTGGAPTVTTRFSRENVSSEGREDPGGGLEFSLSADGRFVAFTGSSSLAPGQSSTGGVFIRDRVSGTTTLATLDANGGPWGTGGGVPGLSPDGRWLAFVASTPLDNASSRLALRMAGPLDDLAAVPGSVPGPVDPTVFHLSNPALSRNGEVLAYLRFDQTLFAHRFSDDSTVSFAQCDGGDVKVQAQAPLPRISDDGTLVAFWSSSMDQRPPQAYVGDTRSGACRVISVSPDGAFANSAAYPLSLTADARYVAFFSDATNLTPDDDNGHGDVFLRDLSTDTTRRIDVGDAGPITLIAALSGDGRRLAFFSDSGLHLRFLDTGQTVKLHDATSASGSYFNLETSDDGSVIAFASFATNVVSDDTNDYSDVFTAEISVSP
jgi:Tol biopolymer transport system component